MNIDEMKTEIGRLKKEKNAIILAHNYQLPEVQDIADFTGDSLELARKAASITEPVIVFCGVYFMAETAAILNPDKKVLIPDMQAGCPLADFATLKQVREWKKVYLDHVFVAYVNTHAETKAEIDICCTSGNAEKVINSIDSDKIVFLPDKNLGDYIRRKTGKPMVLWEGFCVVHEKADFDSIMEAKAMYPEALVMAHPECPRRVLDIADEVCSTGQMFGAVERHPEVRQFIVVTECGMVHALSKRFPDREFIAPEKQMRCANMKKITLPKVLDSLKYGQFEVKIDPVIAEKAKRSIVKMLEIK
ncbi:MAG: quinolinate synthase [Spirochaetes bacterium GWF1_51_8]|nr:MAG: quinolinate synthase [Spirochaetes bacterium GWF1_51_8]